MTRKAANASSPIKRQRRTKAAISSLREGLHQIISDNRPMTVRQVFYQAVSRGLIDKTEAEYKGTICRLLADMRRDGTLPFGWLADNTRWMRKPTTHKSLAAALDRTQRFYRRDVWAEQDVYVEIWLEKDALSGVLYEVTGEWDVPLMVTRGYPSLTFLHSAAEDIDSENRPAFLYYFGDHDPSGKDIPRVVEKTLRELAPEADLTFEVVAVTEDQIAEYDLPTRPTKKSDTRNKAFEGESVEVDALPPSILKQLCEECVTQHVDHYQYEQMKIIEEAERTTLQTIIDSMKGGAA